MFATSVNRLCTIHRDGSLYLRELRKLEVVPVYVVLFDIKIIPQRQELDRSVDFQQAYMLSDALTTSCSPLVTSQYRHLLGDKGKA